MKRILGITALCLLCAGFALPAGAVSLNPKGLGQVLLYPYYTVNKNQDTVMTVVNTYGVGKLVKVRFMEGYNGRAVLEFNLYLSAYDVWSAVVSSPDATATSGARLSWSDSSCIAPFSQNPAPFVSSAYDGTQAGMPNDSGPQTIARTREGHIEIIAMGDIDPGSELGKAITHSGSADLPDSGVPAAANGAAGNCPGIEALTLAAAGNMDTPTSTLFGSAAVINVGEGTFFAYNADAITGFTAVPLLTETGTDHGTLADANSPEATNGRARAYVMTTNGGVPLALDYARGIDAVSAVFMADTLYNEFLAGAGLGANTDWVVTFPTRRYYVDQKLYPSNTLSPFFGAFADGKSSFGAKPNIFDREEGFPSRGKCPPLSASCMYPTIDLSKEVNVISFLTAPAEGTPSGVLGSQLTVNFDPYGFAPYGDAGWMRLTLGTANVVLNEGLGSGKTSDGKELILVGAPVAGFMVYNVINTNAQPGKLANYGGLFPHRSSLSCDTPAYPSPCF